MRWSTAAVAVAVVVVGLGLLAVHWTRSPQERLVDWLRDQPGIESVDHVNSAHGSPGVEAGQIAQPTAEVTTSAPLTAASLRSFMAAFERFGARDAQVLFLTVQLTHGADSVLASAQRAGNVRVATVYDAMRELPGLEAVGIELAPRSPSRVTSGALPVLPSLASTGPRMVAVLAPSTDLPAAAARLVAGVGAAPSATGASAWRQVGLTVQAAGLRHSVTVRGTAGPSPRAAAAFTAAARAEGTRPVELHVTDERRSTSTTLRFSPRSPTLASTQRLVNSLGYGQPAHDEGIEPSPSPDRATDFDVDVWAARALPPVRAVAGVRRAHLALEGDHASGRSVLDVRVGTATDLAELAASVPDAVDVVRVHTAPTALDPDRDDALPEDPEQGCPAGPAGVVNTAYTGPAAQFDGAARFLALLAATGPPTCLHWELSVRAAPTAAPGLAIRVPSLRQRDWQPVVDAILAQRRSGDANRPRIALLVPGTREPWTAMLLLDPVRDEPYASSAVAANPTEMRAAMAALAPLVRYWNARVGRG